MARDDGSAAGTVVLAFVLGAVAGAAVALLVAPASGEETRRILGDKARESRERAEEAARQGREFLNRQRDNVSAAIERGREAYEQARGGTRPQTPPAPEAL
jgi:gas vesicle protein